MTTHCTLANLSSPIPQTNKHSSLIALHKTSFFLLFHSWQLTSYGLTLLWISWMPTSLVLTSRQTVPKSFIRASANSLKLPCSTPELKIIRKEMKTEGKPFLVIKHSRTFREKSLSTLRRLTRQLWEMETEEVDIESHVLQKEKD